MGWGARQWLRLTPEVTFGEYNSGGTAVWVRLDTDNAFTPIITPGRGPIRDAAGGNRPVQMVSSTYSIAGNLSTLLYPTQASALLGWATTISGNDLGSYTADYYDGQRVRRFLGGKVDSLKLSCSATGGEGVLRAEFGLSFQTYAGSDPSLAEPAFSVFPTTIPYVLKQSSTGFTVGGSVRTKYNKFEAMFKNRLQKTYDELAYPSNITYCGRDTSFSTSFQYTATTDQGNYESQTALTCAMIFTHPTNTLTLDFKASGYMSTRTRSMPLGDVSREDYTIESFFDSSATTDFSFTVV